MAHFIGESNIIDGYMIEDGVVEFSGRKFACVDKGFAQNENVDVVIRPEDLEITPPAQGMITGVVELVTFMGMHYIITVDSGGYKWQIRSTKAQEPGQAVGLSVAPDGIHVMRKLQDELPDLIQEIQEEVAEE